MDKNTTIIVSLSGGRTSAFMSIFLKQMYPENLQINVFANTGKEKEETYNFINKLDRHFNLHVRWIEALVNPKKGVGTTYNEVDYKTANRTGKPFEDVIKKYGIPSKLYKHCTRELKQYPIKKFADDNAKKYVMAIGIRADERFRTKPKKNVIYPLIELNITKNFINDWWLRQSFNLQLEEHQGNCDFCFLKSLRKRRQLIKEGLNVDWWKNMERKYQKPFQEKFDARNNLTVSDIEEIVKNDRQLDLFNDVDFDCFCKAD